MIEESFSDDLNNELKQFVAKEIGQLQNQI